MRWKYRSDDQIRRLASVVIENAIEQPVLWVGLDETFRATLLEGATPAAELVLRLNAINAIRRFDDHAVPMIVVLANLIYALRLRGSCDAPSVIEDLRKVRSRAPSKSVALHEARGDFSALGHATSGARDELDAGMTGWTIATAGAVGGALAAAMVAVFPTLWGGLPAGAPWFATACASPPAGGFGAALLWGVAEERQLLRQEQRSGARPPLWRRVLPLGTALLGGAAILLLAHLLAGYELGAAPDPSWLALGLAGALGAIFAACSWEMTTPTTVLRAVWNGTAAAGGTITGFAAYHIFCRWVLPWFHASPPYLANPVQQAAMVTAGAFAFVAGTQSVLALRVRGVEALRSSAPEIPIDRARRFVPTWILLAIMAGAVLLSCSLLAHSLWAR